MYGLVSVNHQKHAMDFHTCHQWRHFVKKKNPKNKNIFSKLTSKVVGLPILRVRSSQENAQERQETSERLHD